jgi:hypothetical protein
MSPDVSRMSTWSADDETFNCETSQLFQSRGRADSAVNYLERDGSQVVFAIVQVLDSRPVLVAVALGEEASHDAALADARPAQQHEPDSLEVRHDLPPSMLLELLRVFLLRLFN